MLASFRVDLALNSECPSVDTIEGKSTWALPRSESGRHVPPVPVSGTVGSPHFGVPTVRVWRSEEKSWKWVNSCHPVGSEDGRSVGLLRK